MKVSCFLVVRFLLVPSGLVSCLVAMVLKSKKLFWFFRFVVRFANENKKQKARTRPRDQQQFVSHGGLWQGAARGEPPLHHHMRFASLTHSISTPIPSHNFFHPYCIMCASSCHPHSGLFTSIGHLPLGATYWHAETLSLGGWHIVLSGGFACVVKAVKWVV
jgi:hypothetical protein